MKSKKSFNVNEYDPFRNYEFVYGDKMHKK